MKRRPWTVALLSVAATLIVLALAGAIAWRRQDVRSYLARQVTPPANWPAAQTSGLRQVLLSERNDAAARGDLARVAMIHADLASEALRRAVAVQRAWMARQDPKTKLFAESVEKPSWNYRNTAADCYGFLLQSSVRLDPSSLPALKATLDAETKLAAPGELCQPVIASTGVRVQENHEQAIFGSSEYVKDGLLSVYEHLGADPVGPRMLAVLDTVLAKSEHHSSFGNLPGGGSEENGNVIQACSRLSFTTGREDYADMAARIADASIGQMLPANHGLPAMRFDYTTNKVVRAKVKLRDHGSEITPGLAEAFALAVARSKEPKWSERANRWAEPLARMYEMLLTKGLNDKGLLIGAIDPSSGDVVDPAPTDNWGYILNGVLLFTQSARRQGQIASVRLDALDERADQIIAAVSRQYGIDWEWGQMDGYADALEGGLYMAAHRPQCAETIVPWIDDQMALLFSRQQESGFVTGGYLDGNFIRTAMMYAEQKSGGWRVEPWREDVRVGMAQGKSGEAVIVVMTTKPFDGVLRPDTARHREIMKLPWDWPRLNSWPQWFVMTEATKVVGCDGLAPTPARDQLVAGLPLKMGANSIVILKLSR